MVGKQGRRYFIGAVGAGSVLWASGLRAQEWPAKPVKIIVPYAAGGVTDMLTRLVATQLGVTMKQPFLVENLPGASGIIASILAEYSVGPRLQFNCRPPSVHER